MIVIGLTGSIGTGKSTVTRQFAQCGAATLNSDRVVHKLLAEGGAAVKQVAKHFPKALKHNAINRKLLGTEVFNDAPKLKLLESVLHPLVRKEQDKFIRAARQKGEELVVLDIPLLFETGGEKRCDYVVVTTAPPEVQRQRVLARKGMTVERFAQILASQMPDKEKRRRADFIVETGLGMRQSLKAVKQILLRLKAKDASVKP